MESPSRRSGATYTRSPPSNGIAWTRLFAAVVLAALVLGVSLALVRYEASAQTPRPPSLVLIDEARQRGELDVDTALLYKAYTLFAPERLPASYQSDTPAKSGTMVFVEIDRSWDDLRPETRDALAKLAGGYARRDSAADGPATLEWPTLVDEQTHTTTHYVIHYTVAGTDTVHEPDVDDAPANGVPDYVDWVAEDLETVWRTEIGTMGWLEPPPDAGEGGDTRYDVYLQNMSYYGYAVFDEDSKIGDNPNSPTVTETDAYYSYLALENDFTTFDGDRRSNIRVTLAHEFNHAIQFGYDGTEAVWLMEATATWIEDEVYDDINDNYQFLDKLFEKPDVALDTDAYAYGYSRFLFPRYIAEHHSGQTTVRTVWENAVLSDSLNAVEGALAGASTSFAQLFPRFIAANYVLSPEPYNAPYTYEEADGYRAAVGGMEIEAYFPFTGTTVTYDSYEDGNGRLERHSAEYWVITTTDGFTLTFEGNTSTDYVVQGAVREGDRVTLTQVPLASQEGTFAVYDPGAYDEVTVIVANVGDTDEEESYALRLQSTGETPPTATFSVDPISGTWTTTEFTFDASASSDGQTPSEALVVRWDWEGDHVWDTGWAITKTVTHTFALPGTYSVTLEVRDEIGLRGTATRSVAATALNIYVPVVLRS